MRLPTPRTRLMPSRKKQIWAAIASVLLSAQALAMWMSPNDAPVGRLIENVSRYVKDNPNDSEGYFTLARVHSLAFSLKTDTVSVWSETRLPRVCTDDFQVGDIFRSPPGTPASTEPRKEKLVEHLTESIKGFEKAISLAPSMSLASLGLASVLEKGLILADDAGVVPGATPLEKLSAEKKVEIEKLITGLQSKDESQRKKSRTALRARLDDAAPLLLAHRKTDDEAFKKEICDLLREQWREQAIKHFLNAYELAIVKDSKINEQPMRGLRTLASYESGKAYMRLMTARGTRTDAEKQQFAKVTKGIQDLEAKPPNMAMTPVIFSLEGPAPLSDLLAPDTIVMFDLDGDGRPEPRPWVRPDTAILVWDPTHAGVITSGRQLFGSVTWWIFFSSGYRAMDALDDDRDAKLSGSEFTGLSIWFDRNSNAQSEPGEVIPIEDLPIASLATRATSIAGISPTNLVGLTLTDGRVMPTYDWVVPSIPPASLVDLAVQCPTSLTPRPASPLASIQSLDGMTTHRTRRRRHTRGLFSLL